MERWYGRPCAAARLRYGGERTHPHRAARILRGSGPRHRNGGTGHSGAWRADLRAWRDRAQQTRRRDRWPRRARSSSTEPEQVPEGAMIILSAHGSAPEVYARCRRSGADRSSTRPAHWSARCMPRCVATPAKGATVLLVGHPEHDEVIGTRGEAPERVDRRRGCRRRRARPGQGSGQRRPDDPDHASLDDTAAIVAVLRSVSRHSKRRHRATSVTPRRTVRTRSRLPWSMIVRTWCWSSVRRIPRTPNAWSTCAVPVAPTPT